MIRCQVDVVIVEGLVVVMVTESGWEAVRSPRPVSVMG